MSGYWVFPGANDASPESLLLAFILLLSKDDIKQDIVDSYFIFVLIHDAECIIIYLRK